MQLKIINMFSPLRVRYLISEIKEGNTNNHKNSVKHGRVPNGHLKLEDKKITSWTTMGPTTDSNMYLNEQIISVR